MFQFFDEVVTDRRLRLARGLTVEDISGVVEHEIRWNESGPSVEVRILAAEGASRQEIERFVREGMESLFLRFRVKRPQLAVTFVDFFHRDDQVMGKKKDLQKFQAAGNN